MTRVVHFVIPIRHPGQVRDVAGQQRGLRQTLASLFAQTDPRFTVRIACNPDQSLPEAAGAAQICEIDLPPNAALAAASDRAAVYAAIRRDKGQRIAAALDGMAKDDFVMVADDDDLVHRDLARHVLKADGAQVGHFVHQGYLWPDGAARMRRIEDFHRRCGTSLIVPAHYFAWVGQGARDAAAIDALGSHRIVAPRPGAPAFAPVPFPGAIYRLGHPNASQVDVTAARGLAGAAVAQAKRLRDGLVSRQPLDAGIVHDFFGGLDPLGRGAAE